MTDPLIAAAPRRPPGQGVVPPNAPDNQRERQPLDRRLLLVGIWVGAAFVGIWPIVAAPAPPPGGAIPLVPTTAHVAGMLAGYGILILVALMARTPVLERDVGADVLTRWHTRGARLVMGLIILHAWSAVAAWAQSRDERSAIAAWHVLRLPWLMAATVGTALLIAVATASARAARHRLSYEQWHTLHLVTYLAVALTFAHQLAGPDLAGHRLLQIAWALLYVHVFALVLRHRVLTPLRQANRHRLRVADGVTEGPDAVSIEIEGRHLDELRAEAGQFFRWRFLTPDHWRSAHPFSLSAPPTDHRLRLTVKSLGGGSKSLQTIGVGTWVIAEGPYGAMTAARRTRPNVLLIAGGVGITPMRALFETIPITPDDDLTLIYRARSPAHLLLRDELDHIAHRRRAHLHYLVGNDPHCLEAETLRRLVPDLADRDVYLCGPPPMATAVRGALRQLGLPPGQLHDERFGW